MQELKDHVQERLRCYLIREKLLTSYDKGALAMLEFIEEKILEIRRRHERENVEKERARLRKVGCKGIKAIVS